MSEVLRGDVGRAGHCPHCRLDMPDGPDACLGTLPGVSHACCGHGIRVAYVVLGGQPDQGAHETDHITMYGPPATEFFRLEGKTVPDDAGEIEAIVDTVGGVGRWA